MEDFDIDKIVEVEDDNPYYEHAPEYGERAWRARGKIANLILQDFGNGDYDVVGVEIEKCPRCGLELKAVIPVEEIYCEENYSPKCVWLGQGDLCIRKTKIALLKKLEKLFPNNKRICEALTEMALLSKCPDEAEADSTF